MSLPKEYLKFNRIHNKDARTIDRLIKDKVVDVVITSPPYFDLKDYGSSKQIGYGQDYLTYLNDLKKVFEKIHRITKDDGSLWVIIDVFRREGELLLLPFDFANKIKEVGWYLQDIIIWSKDKTVPWVHDGQMRNLYEYVLVFSKNKNFKFYIDRVRDWDNLKKWWIRYPERYNPKGKAPTGVWEYGIPTQGAWGNGYIRHFCPLPEGLVENIIKLTTNEGDVVLDPFAGTGTVLLKAEQMNRKYIGTELNAEYISMFNKYRDKVISSDIMNMSTAKSFTQEEFENTILQLRALKFAKILHSKLSKRAEVFKSYIFVPANFDYIKEKHKVIRCAYHFYVKTVSGENTDWNALASYLYAESSNPPLSKFGIDPIITIHNSSTDFQNLMVGKEIFKYSLKNTHKAIAKVYVNEIIDIFSSEPILSDISLNINEQDFD